MQYCSLQHRTLLLSPVTSTAGYCFCFGSIPSFFLELFFHLSPVAYWAPTDLGSSSLFPLKTLNKGQGQKRLPIGTKQKSVLCYKVILLSLPMRVRSLPYKRFRSSHSWAITPHLLIPRVPGMEQGWAWLGGHQRPQMIKMSSLMGTPPSSLSLRPNTQQCSHSQMAWDLDRGGEHH